MSTSGTFTYVNPPTIHWGRGSRARLADELRALNAARPFVVTTRSVGGNSGLMQSLTSGLDVVGVSSIGQHAPAASIAAAVSEASRARPDALISFGGGSPIDAAKIVAFALATGLDVADPSAAALARGLNPAASDVLPHVAVPTTLSAAELSALAGFTTEDEREKVGLRGQALLPRAVIYDAELTLETPLELWLATGIRAVDHAVETVLAAGTHPLPDTLALDALGRLRQGLLATRREPKDPDPRTESQIGAWFSFALPGPAASGLSHTLGKRIGAPHGIPHGVCSCLLLPHVMRYLAPRTLAQQARIAAALGVDIRERPLEQAAACAADAVFELIAQLGLPQRLAAYHLSDADLESAARPVASADTPLDDLLTIYRAAQ